MNPIVTFLLCVILFPFWLWGWFTEDKKLTKIEWVTGVIMCSVLMVAWIYLLIVIGTIIF